MSVLAQPSIYSRKVTDAITRLKVQYNKVKHKPYTHSSYNFLYLHGSHISGGLI